MAKSFVSTLIGIAIDEGLIQSVHDTITQYIPELAADPFGKITIEHLLNMQSGLKFNEGYTNPFGHVAKFYYGLNLKKFTKPLKAETTPGSRFKYISVDTQLLAWILEKATGKKVSEYFPR